MSDAVPMPGENMGQPIPRYEAHSKVSGSARYASDFPVADPLYAFMVTSAIARGRITSIDEGAARGVPGVCDVLTYRNRPLLHPVDYLADGLHALEHMPGLSGPEIRYEGELVAMVLAESFEAAREAAHKVAVSYNREAPSASFDSQGLLVQAATEVFPERKDAVLGEAETAFASSPVQLDATYTTPPEHHAPIELFSTTVSWLHDEVLVYESSQAVHVLRNVLAQTLGIEPNRVRVISNLIGGGFGSKAAMTRRTALAAVASRKHRRPVKLVQTRNQGFQMGHRPESRQRIRIGADRDGRFTAYLHDLLEITARNDPYVAPGGIGANAATYRFPTVASTRRFARADRSPPMAMRAPSEVALMFSLESAIDELAVSMGLDPVEVRRINDTDRDMVSGKPFTSRSLMRCYDEAAAAFGWSRRTPKPGSMSDGEWMIGWGCATAHYPTYATSAVVRVRLSVDGTATLQTSGSDLGTGAYTIFGQEVAWRLGLSPDRVRVEMGDTTLPPGPIAGGSTGSASGCSAIRLACDAILKRLQISAVSDGDQRQAAFDRLGVGEVEAQGDFVPPGVEERSTASAYRGSPAFMGGEASPKAQFAFGAEFVEVRIHRRTREIRVPRMVGAFAAGRILNPRTARSQLMGGLIWGMSSALLEAVELDAREARYINDNLAEYLIPVNADIHNVEVIFVPEVDEECNPAGVKGLGELGNVGTAAAIANAVYHATGTRVRDLPITIDKLFGA